MCDDVHSFRNDWVVLRETYGKPVLFQRLNNRRWERMSEQRNLQYVDLKGTRIVTERARPTIENTTRKSALRS